MKVVMSELIVLLNEAIPYGGASAISSAPKEVVNCREGQESAGQLVKGHGVSHAPVRPDVSSPASVARSGSQMRSDGGSPGPP